jgi:hypothetical protein
MSGFGEFGRVLLRDRQALGVGAVDVRGREFQGAGSVDVGESVGRVEVVDLHGVESGARRSRR